VSRTHFADIRANRYKNSWGRLLAFLAPTMALRAEHFGPIDAPYVGRVLPARDDGSSPEPIDPLHNFLCENTPEASKAFDNCHDMIVDPVIGYVSDEDIATAQLKDARKILLAGYRIGIMYDVLGQSLMPALDPNNTTMTADEWSSMESEMRSQAETEAEDDDGYVKSDDDLEGIF